MESLAGKFLIAGPTLLDPNFVRSVVLIVRHDDEGAFGLVVNRPIPNVTIGAALGETMPTAAENGEPIYAGGPCQGVAFILHTDPTIGGEEASDGVYATTDREAIESLLQNQIEPFKLFASYSGWGAGQLESELTEGSWVVCPSSQPEIFSIDPHLWSRLHARAQLSKFVPIERIPDDPHVN